VAEAVSERGTDLIASIEELLAKQAIREVLQNYCRGYDRLDRKLLLSVWHPDARIDYEGELQGTREEIVDFFLEHTPGYAAHSHQITNVAIVVKGDVAASEAYVTARLRSYPDETGRQVDMFISGRYLDRWSRRDGRWAIDQRQFINDLHSEYEVVTDFGNLPGRADTSSTAGRRDPDDPSYALLSSVTPRSRA
jgi:hypothetical protein